MNQSYVISGNFNDRGLTDIARIGAVKKTGDEWSVYTKKISLDSLPNFAAIRLDAMGVCGIYVNGDFVGATTGRYANRILYAECTSKLKSGENEIKLILGGHFYQTTTNEIRKRRGAHFSCLAAELELCYDNHRLTYATNTDWKRASDEGVSAPDVFSQVTKGEYDRFWLSAALSPEATKITVPHQILEVAKGYSEYISKPNQIFATPSTILNGNMEKCGDALCSSEARSHVLYEFDRLYCGYVRLECEAEDDGTVELRFDYTTYPEDLEFETPQHNISAKRLTLTSQIKKGENKLFFLNRRAAKYVKLIFTTKVKLTTFGFELDLMEHDKIGYFNCSEPVFNQMWEIGKYTLHINKHEEYESCPRNEMKYFSGDGIIDALVDAYAFGDGKLTVSSLSYTEMTSNLGLRPDPFIKNIGLWEYPAWRIIHAYNHYFYFNDTYLVKQHFDELTSCLVWMIGKMNANHLIYQYPVMGGAFARDNSSTDYTQSPDRLGEKALTNALLYRSLVCMSEMAEIVGDPRAEKWRALSEKVKKAINDRLWSDKLGAYLDIYDPTYVPQDGNALCVLFGIADKGRADTILKTLQKTTWTPYGSTVSSKLDPHPFAGNDTVSPLMNTYESEARFLSGDGDGAVELLRRCFGGMIAKGATSFWEYCPANDSPKPKHFTSCHAWSTGCTYLLGAYVLGIRPDSAGYERVHFEPYGGFEYFEGVVPTDRGLIAVRCETLDGKQKFTIAVPKNTSVNSVLPENSTLEMIEY